MQDHEVLNNLGVALRKANRLDEAIDAYERALALKPDVSSHPFACFRVCASGAVLLSAGRSGQASWFCFFAGACNHMRHPNGLDQG